MKHSLRVIAVLVLLVAARNVNAERLVLVGASYGKNILAICDAKGDPVWQHKTAGPQRGHTGHHDASLVFLSFDLATGRHP